MKYKALILDLDGTVMPYTGKTDSLPSPRVLDVILKARDKIHISVATGRPLELAVPIITHLRLTSPCVICNGIQIYDPGSKEVISESAISGEALSEIMAVIRNFPLQVHYYDGFRAVAGDPLNTKGKVLSVYLPKINPLMLDKVIKSLEHIKGIALHQMPSWDRGNAALDITDSGTSKLHRIVEVFKLLGVTKEETIGVGDSYNDYPLLMACGLKIAMGNAVSELKEIADFIAPSVDNDGVAAIIEKFILNSQ